MEREGDGEKAVNVARLDDEVGCGGLESLQGSRAVLRLLKGQASVSHCVEPSPLLARVREFLPQMQQANAELARSGEERGGSLVGSGGGDLKSDGLEPKFVEPGGDSGSSASDSDTLDGQQEVGEVERRGGELNDEERLVEVNMNIYVNPEIHQVVSTQGKQESSTLSECGANGGEDDGCVRSQGTARRGEVLMKEVRSTRATERIQKVSESD